MQTTDKEELFTTSFFVFSVAAIFIYLLQLWQPVFIGGILAIVMYPLYQRIDRLVGDGLAAALTVLVATVLVIAPVAYGVYYFVQQATQLAILVSDPTSSEAVMLTTFLDRIRPAVENFFGLEVTLSGVAEYLRSKIDLIAGWTQSVLVVIGTGLFAFAFGLAVVLFAQFYFLIYGESLVSDIYELSPVPRAFTQRVTDEFWQMTLVMVKTTAIIGLIQGVTGGIGLWIADTPRVLMWTVIMVFLSILPILGAMAVLLPTTLWYVFVTQDYTAGAIVAITLIVVTVGDNFLKPIIVGQSIEMKPPWVLVGAVAGIPLFGVLGFLFGPILLALPLAFLDVYKTRKQATAAAVEAIPFTRSVTND